MRSPYANGGYVGSVRAAFNQPLFAPTLDSVGGGSVATSLPTSWSHNVVKATAGQTFLIAAVSQYPNGDSSGFYQNTTVTVNGVAMTMVSAGFRLALFTAPVSTAGNKTISLTNASYPSTYVAANTLCVTDVISLGTAVQTGQDTGTHTITGVGTTGGLIAFFTGQAYNSTAPTNTGGDATQAFWMNNINACAAGGFIAPASASVPFSVATGQYGSAAYIPINGRG